MQVGEQIPDLYDQYLFKVVPTPAEQRVNRILPEVTDANYTTWYMKICAAAIKNNLALIDLVDEVDPAILNDPEFFTMVLRKNVNVGSDMKMWEDSTENVVRFVENVNAAKKLQVTNSKGSKGFTHEGMVLFPHKNLEKMLGDNRGGAKCKSKKSKKSKKTKSNKSFRRWF
jgi:hypothetical protein